MKKIFYIMTITLLFNINIAHCAYNNSPCQNPYAKTYTVCEYNNCTTYCDNPTTINSAITYPRGYSFSYTSPYGSFRVSNEFFGLNVITRPAVYYHHRPPIVVGHPGLRPPMGHYRPARPAKPVRPVKVKK